VLIFAAGMKKKRDLILHALASIDSPEMGASYTPVRQYFTALSAGASPTIATTDLALQLLTDLLGKADALHCVTPASATLCAIEANENRSTLMLFRSPSKTSEEGYKSNQINYLLYLPTIKNALRQYEYVLLSDFRQAYLFGRQDDEHSFAELPFADWAAQLAETRSIYRLAFHIESRQTTDNSLLKRFPEWMKRLEAMPVAAPDGLSTSELAFKFLSELLLVRWLQTYDALPANFLEKQYAQTVEQWHSVGAEACLDRFFAWYADFFGTFYGALFSTPNFWDCLRRTPADIAAFQQFFEQLIGHDTEGQKGFKGLNTCNFRRQTPEHYQQVAAQQLEAWPLADTWLLPLCEVFRRRQSLPTMVFRQMHPTWPSVGLSAAFHVWIPTEKKSSGKTENTVFATDKNSKKQLPDRKTIIGQYLQKIRIAHDSDILKYAAIYQLVLTILHAESHWLRPSVAMAKQINQLFDQQGNIFTADVIMAPLTPDMEVEILSGKSALKSQWLLTAPSAFLQDKDYAEVRRRLADNLTLTDLWECEKTRRNEAALALLWENDTPQAHHAFRLSFGVALQATQATEGGLLTYQNWQQLSPEERKIPRFKQAADARLFLKINHLCSRPHREGLLFKSELGTAADQKFWQKETAENTLPICESRLLQAFGLHKRFVFQVDEEKAGTLLLSKEANRLRMNLLPDKKNYEIVGMFNEKAFATDHRQMRLAACFAPDEPLRAAILPPKVLVAQPLVVLQSYDYQLDEAGFLQQTQLPLVEHAYLSALINSPLLQYYAQLCRQAGLGFGWQQLPIPKVSEAAKQTLAALAIALQNDAQLSQIAVAQGIALPAGEKTELLAALSAAVAEAYTLTAEEIAFLPDFVHEEEAAEEESEVIYAHTDTEDE
jgi:hypothetical protein